MTSPSDIVTLLLLGIALGFDSFRVSLGIGALKPALPRQCALAAAFGICDGIAPLFGLWLGRGASELLGSVTALAGPLLLAAYGIYLLLVSWLRRETEEEARWHFLGLPVLLSLDNFAAGAGLGMLGYSAIISAAVLGLMSGVLAFAGLQLGGVMARGLPFPATRVSGVMLLVAALVAMFDPN